MRHLLLLIALLLCTFEAFAATYQFDLTSHFGGGLPSVVDLGVQFEDIEDATFTVEGLFEPGLMQATSPSFPNTNPLIETDTVVLSLILSDSEASGSANDLSATYSFEGEDGAVSAQLEIEQKGNIFTGSSVPNYQVLEDGVFNLSSIEGHTVSFLYGVIENPQFELSKLTLTIEATAIPEPSCYFLFMCGCTALIANRREVIGN